ncbi:rab11 family-interacting protein 4A isoform X2 [Monomorium pharaonis]|uniref:rab11 family-interacting protein 4A isoform X2 n=1 Tax=Monomorium pharaonis TaxID=307658 RepID=UPI00174718A5|nr:rab11 family-interacting protein 4A isoform X2 [Monomorium pharaonis]
MVSSRTCSVNVTSTVNGNGGVAADGGTGNVPREDEGRAANGDGGGVVGPQEWNPSGPPSLSMSVDLHNLVSSTLTDSGRYSASPDEHHQTATSAGAANAIKIGCHDEEESYEGFGSVEGDLVDDGPESPGGSSSAPSPTGTNSHRNPRSPNSTVGRHSWLRTSLRRTPPCSTRKRLSTNALASGSFNSSGMGSNYDAADDVYSDVSLEDVMDLSHKVQMIQEQMDALADTKSVGEERYARAKQENATLQARILMLEEAAKDAETRAEERLQTEQRRHREWASRLERERQLQLENYAIKLQSAEVDSSSLREEIARVREQLEKARADKTRLENDLREVRREADAARESERHAISRANETHHMLDAMREELSLRSEDQQRIEELMQQVAQLQARNKSLEESRDELQAAAALQAGRELLMLNPCSNNAEKGPSLAAELLAGMNPDQIDGQGELNELCTMAELKQALKEQQEVNTQLRTYIDGILLNIVENYPQLLEVKQTH